MVRSLCLYCLFWGDISGAYEECAIYVSLFLPIFLAMGMDTITVVNDSLYLVHQIGLCGICY